MTELDRARAEVRHSFRSGSVGQLYSGIIWLGSALAWTISGTTAGVVILIVGGFFIYPVTAVVSRLLGGSGSIAPTNPLREAGFTIPIVGALSIPVAAAATLYDINWFYPAFMVIMGAHYLPFSHLYGMRVFLFLGAGMWVTGVCIGLWAGEASVTGAWLTGLALVAVGVWASRQHRIEFGRIPVGSTGSGGG